LLLRGSRLSAGTETGMVLVFDDITRMRQAQRLAAWGEVAQRLAHEIKNPLTPISCRPDACSFVWPTSSPARKPRFCNVPRKPLSIKSQH
jgi:hypothetical protein